jgi:hypothetical protein
LSAYRVLDAGGHDAPAARASWAARTPSGDAARFSRPGSSAAWKVQAVGKQRAWPFGGGGGRSAGAYLSQEELSALRTKRPLRVTPSFRARRSGHRRHGEWLRSWLGTGRGVRGGCSRAVGDWSAGYAVSGTRSTEGTGQHGRPLGLLSNHAVQPTACAVGFSNERNAASAHAGG